MKFLEAFDAYLCLNLPSSVDRRKAMEDRFRIVGLGDKVEFFAASGAGDVDLEEVGPGWWAKLPRKAQKRWPRARRLRTIALNMSYVRMMNYLLEERPEVETVLLMQDDCVFGEGFHEQFDSFWSRVPEDWDSLNLLTNAKRLRKHGQLIDDRGMPHIWRHNRGWSMVATAFRRRVFQEMRDGWQLSIEKAKKPNGASADSVYGRAQRKHVCYCPIPRLVHHAVGRSDLQARSRRVYVCNNPLREPGSPKLREVEDGGKTLYAGPFVGEFGYELCGWQAGLRKLASKYERVVVVCRPAMQPLYADFAHSFIDAPSGERTNCLRCGDVGVSEVNRQIASMVSEGDFWLKPRLFLPREQSFIQFGRWRPSSYDILIHARASTKFRTARRNYPPKEWEVFLKKGRKYGWRVASVGSPDGAMHVPGTTDLRGISLHELFDVMASADLIVGPTSGPIHLAALCGLPQVTWGRFGPLGAHKRFRAEKWREEDRVREHWNPFNTLVDLTEQPPEPKKLKVRVMQMRKRLRAAGKGGYRRRTLGLKLKEQLDGWRHVCEVGCGHCTMVQLAPLFDEAEKVTLVEAFPPFARSLEVQWPSADVRCFAVADQEERLVFKLTGGGTKHVVGVGAPAEGQKPAPEHFHNGQISVRGKPFSAVDDGTIDVLSIDVEGSEWFVLKHMKSRPRIIAIEMCSREKPKWRNKYEQEIRQWLAEEGYRLLFKEDLDEVYELSCH